MMPAAPARRHGAIPHRRARSTGGFFHRRTRPLRPAISRVAHRAMRDPCRSSGHASMSSHAARWFIRIAIVLAVVVALLAAAAWAVLSQPAFGARMSGARLDRAKANPSYRDGRFVNLQPEAPTRLAAMGDDLVRQFSGTEVREPPARVPGLAVGKAELAAAPAGIGLRAFWISGSATRARMSRSTACACCSTRCLRSASRRCRSARGASIRHRSGWPSCRGSTPS